MCLIFVFLPTLLLIIGIVMYTVCDKPGTCGDNPEISEAGLLMVMISSTMMGMYICFFCIAGSCVAISRPTGN